MNNNAYYRSRASELVKANWGKMIGMALLIGLCSFAIYFVGVLIAGLLGQSSGGLAVALTLIISVASGIISVGLSMGYTASLIQMHDGQQVPASNVFCRVRRSLPAFGLMLWIYFKTILWSLPGYAIAFIGTMIGGTFGGIIAFIGSVVSMVFTIRAAYSYALSTYFFADDENCGVFEAVNDSIAAMDGRRFELFKLTIPYALIIVAAMVVFSIIIAIVGNMGSFAAVVSIVGVIALIVLCAIVAMLSTMATVCFYRGVNGGSSKTETKATL